MYTNLGCLKKLYGPHLSIHEKRWREQHVGVQGKNGLIRGKILVGINGMHKLRIKHKGKAHCYLKSTLTCYYLSLNSN